MKKKENPNAFKHWIGEDLVQRISDSISGVYPSFKAKEFLSIAPKLEPLELKPRVQLLRDHLHRCLPADYEKALKILLRSLRAQKLKGFDLWPYTEFVQTFGLEHVEASLDALRQLTQIFTGEFAVRPFLKKHPEATLRYLEKCAIDENSHVRRWASEGSRPRLPWGERLDAHIKEPTLTFAILNSLKFDEELYVRKSVANHLNDVSKDNPEAAIKLLRQWQRQAGRKHKDKIDWITRHALRTLIKLGHREAMTLVGAGNAAKIKTTDFKVNRKAFKVNDRMRFSFVIQSASSQAQKIIIDYIIHYQKANRTTAPKVYKLKTFVLGPRESVRIEKNHHLKLITTRRYHPGDHRLEVQINGRVFDGTDWKLSL